MKYVNSIKVMLFSSCAAAAIGVAGEASAAADQGNQVQEVVVTAQRRAERLEDVPMSVTAITADSVASRGLRNLQDLGQAVAGVQIGFQGNFVYPAVRGITSATTGVGFENNVGVYVDGYYQPDVNSINQDFANIESVQVLKGPQGALYGRNATGGAILITTPKPSHELTGNIEAKYGSYKDRTLSGYISGPITDRLRASLTGFYRKTPGYYDLLNINGVKIGKAAPIHNYSGRLKVEADLTDNLLVTVAYNYNELLDSRGAMFTMEQYRGAGFPPKIGRLYDPRTNAGNLMARNMTITTEGTITVAWTTPIGTLTSYTGKAYRPMKGDFDFDGTPIDLSSSNVRYAEDTFQQTVDYVIDAIDHLDLVVGGTYYYDRAETRFSDGYSGFRRASRGLVTYDTKAWAVYADGTYHVTDKLAISTGARFTTESRHTRAATILYTAAAPGGVYAAPPTPGNRTFHNFSPRISVRYEVADNTNVYASFSRGFRSGFVQLLANVPVAGQTFVNVIQPEKITAYEVGFKTAQRTFRFDTAAFYYDDKDFHVGLTIPNPANPNVPLNITSNAKKAEVYGVEGQLTFSPIENLDVTMSAAYVHARFKDFTNAANVGWNAATGLNVNQISDWSGQQMLRAPDFSATLGVSYTFEEVVGGKLVPAINVKYTDSYVPNNASIWGPLAGATLANQQRFRQGGYTLLNGSINWTDADGHYSVGIWANNITNLKYHLSRNGTTVAGGANYGAWAWPRQVGARIGYAF